MAEDAPSIIDTIPTGHIDDQGKGGGYNTESTEYNSPSFVIISEGGRIVEEGRKLTERRTIPVKPLEDIDPYSAQILPESIQNGEYVYLAEDTLTRKPNNLVIDEANKERSLHRRTIIRAPSGDENTSTLRITRQTIESGESGTFDITLKKEGEEFGTFIKVNSRGEIIMFRELTTEECRQIGSQLLTHTAGTKDHFAKEAEADFAKEISRLVEVV